MSWSWEICRDNLRLQSAIVITISPVLRLQLTQTAQELKITNNLTTAPVLPHVSQTPIGINNQGGHGGDWRQIVDGEVLLCSDQLILRPLSAPAQNHDQTRQGSQPHGQLSSMKGAMDWILSRRVTDQQDKDKTYWIDEIAFLEARLNGSQGDIDNEDRAACEEALKAAKANLAASH